MNRYGDTPPRHGGICAGVPEVCRDGFRQYGDIDKASNVVVMVDANPAARQGEGMRGGDMAFPLHLGSETPSLYGDDVRGGGGVAQSEPSRRDSAVD